jgi:polysaccharide biosynthesis transport protein
LFQSLTEADVEREILKAQLRSLTDTPAPTNTGTMSPGLLEFQVENQDEIHTRQKGIVQLQAQMEQFRNKSERLEKNPQWETNPTYVALKTEMVQQKKDLESAKIKLRDLIVAQLKEQHQDEREQQIAKMKGDLNALDARRQLLSDRYEDQAKKQETGGGKSVELEFARAELAREDKVFELIANRKLALQTELRAPARVQLRHEALVPTVPLEPIPYKLLFLTCSAVFVAPFGLATLREITVRRISDVEQLAQESGLRVLGEVASLPVRYVAVSPKKLSGRLRRDMYIFAESINSLRTNLSMAGGSHDPQVVAVTSSSPSEGKTSVAVSLAMSIANATKKPTLVIDGDMRSPTVATMLKAKSQPGLFELLSKQCKLDDVIQRVGDSELYVIPGGRATRSTHTVVAMAEIKGLLDQLRSRFSKIVVDTPPILGASESLVLSKAADSVLFCSLSGVSKARQLRLAIDRLEHAHVNIAGAVLSGTPAKRYEYLYGYYANRIEANE